MTRIASLSAVCVRVYVCVLLVCGKCGKKQFKHLTWLVNINLGASFRHLVIAMKPTHLALAPLPPFSLSLSLSDVLQGCRRPTTTALTSCHQQQQRQQHHRLSKAEAGEMLADVVLTDVTEVTVTLQRHHVPLLPHLPSLLALPHSCWLCLCHCPWAFS